MRDIYSEIQDKLCEIEKKEQVRILHAVESGSRAWGFASPDSDYDVRFVYVRKSDDYLRLNPSKDVIEWQLDEVLDINGWDLKKALIQFHRGNATLFEWSNSPIIYRTTEAWNHIYEQAKAYFSIKSAIYHYYGTANSTCQQYLQSDEIKYKKYFYALRPLLACRYVEEYQCPPPVLFDELMKIPLDDGVRTEIEYLLEKKKQTEEQDLNPRIPRIDQFISSELERQKRLADQMKDDRTEDWEPLDRIFKEALGRS